MRRLLLAALAASSAGCTGLFFYPSRRLYALPEDYGYRYEIVRFHSLDGTRLTGLFLKPWKRAARGTVVHFHGNAENVSSHFGYSAWLTALDYQVFLLDYRGYGGSEGRPSEDGIVEDAIAALDYVRSRPDVDPKRLAVWGQSLGGAVAAVAVARSTVPVRALVLEDTFASYRAVARAALRKRLWTRPLAWLAWPLVSDRQAPERYLGRLPPCRVLVVHGDADPVVPFALGEAVYEKINQPKEFLRIPGGGHLDAFAKRAAEYRPALVSFLNKALR